MRPPSRGRRSAPKRPSIPRPKPIGRKPRTSLPKRTGRR